jgi:hypothetical protein
VKLSIFRGMKKIFPVHSVKTLKPKKEVKDEVNLSIIAQTAPGGFRLTAPERK